MAKKFKDLTEREILALAIQQEEEDSKIYGEFAAALGTDFPASQKIFQEMQKEESEHRRRLTELYVQHFGDRIVLIKRDDVRGFIKRRPTWLVLKLGLKGMRQQAEIMELETSRFYETAATRTSNAAIRTLLTDLAEAERQHSDTSAMLREEHLTPSVQKQEDEARRRLFVLQIVQPGLAGLMDGSVSTLAPIFAVALYSHSTWPAFLAGLATSVGAGISMGFAEALSDDGALTGRGHPLARGAVCGLMTAGGGLGHTLPFLIPQYHVALSVAIVVVFIELMAISWIRYKYMDTPLWQSFRTVFIGGMLVFLAGIAIGYFGGGG